MTFALPSTDPLYRLHVYDGLMMNSHRWLLSDQYHRRRQNIHYQSLNQPGIVYGLGVRVIDPPKETSLQERRWLEIQPGIAIDIAGNPIIVEQPVTYGIVAELPRVGSLTVYLFISYLEFEQPQQQPPSPQIRQWIRTDENNAESIREWFQIDEKTKPLNRGKEIELCRIQIEPGRIQIAKPDNVFNPGVNQLDFRYRPVAQSRPQTEVKVAQLQQGANFSGTSTSPFNHDGNQENIACLIQALSALYPALQGARDIAQVTLWRPETLRDCTLLHLTDWELSNLDEAALSALTDFVKQGSMILVEVGDRSLLQTIQDIITTKLEISLQSWQDFSPNPLLQTLRTQPFTFAALPQISQQSIEVWIGQGVVLVMGELSNAWGLGDGLSLDRNTIRTAQEFGVNIFQLACQRWHMSQLHRDPAE